MKTSSENIAVKLPNFSPGLEFTDIHCHCLPGLDDGPVTIDRSIDLCEMLVADGVTTVIATPHQLGKFDGCNRSGEVRQAVGDLSKELKDRGILLEVLPGADIRIDERIPSLLQKDKVLTLADGHKYILIELPHEMFINIKPLLPRLGSMGISAIISHPERNSVLMKQPQSVCRWLEHSVYLQITAASILGQFGPGPQKAAWYFLSSHLASLVATDAHDTLDRRPRMSLAFKRISQKLGARIAHLVCVENPGRVVKGQDILPVHSSCHLAREEQK